jgi:hypothetical protein
MATTVKRVTKARRSNMILHPGSITVERAGVPGPSAMQPYGKPIITTLRTMRQTVPADMWDDPFWGRGRIVDGNLDEEFLSSNDCQRFSWTADINGSKAHPKHILMTVGDPSDVDRTGSTFYFNEVRLTVPFGPSGRIVTFEITTTDDKLEFTVDSGTMPAMAGAPAHGVADGIAIRLPCLKVV